MRLWREDDGALHDHTADDDRWRRCNDQWPAAEAEYADGLRTSLEWSREQGWTDGGEAAGTESR